MDESGRADVGDCSGTQRAENRPQGEGTGRSSSIERCTLLDLFPCNISFSVREVCNLSKIHELAEQAEGCNEQLRTNVNYDQFSEDEAKEKAQGYARNGRQRNVAMLIKDAQAIGLNARRAVTLNQEKITQESITGVHTNSQREQLVRVCAGGRNVCIKRANHVNGQLSVATRKHFSGVIGKLVYLKMKY